ncbi:MAG: type IV pilin protein [Salinisphaeraceae bacterium]
MTFGVRVKAGFSLIELVIAVAIVGILAAIAYPSYVNQVRESRRTDAQRLLLEAANRQERVYTTSSPNSYADNMGAGGLNYPNDKLETEGGWYQIVANGTDTNADGINEGFTLEATALEDQRKDDCVVLRLDHLGQRTASNAIQDGKDVSAECW